MRLAGVKRHHPAEMQRPQRHSDQPSHHRCGKEQPKRLLSEVFARDCLATSTFNSHHLELRKE
jgi:hypothetical protein